VEKKKIFQKRNAANELTGNNFPDKLIWHFIPPETHFIASCGQTILEDEGVRTNVFVTTVFNEKS
jgi:hypothetical protein